MKTAHSSRQQHTPRWLRLGLTILALLLAMVALLSYTVETLDARPRALARYVERVGAGHRSVVAQAAERLAALLDWLDQPLELRPRPQNLRLGAQAGPLPQQGAADAGARVVLVASPEDATQAIQRARPGDRITFAPGIYRFSGTSIAVTRAGTKAAPILLRADRPETVFLEFDMTEGFVVSAPHWTFENMNIRGVCAQHAACEHAFHVVSLASHFVARNNTVTDFNAHIKINGADGSFPDNGLIEGNTLSNRSIRETQSSVTPIDLVAASRWIVRDNWISDFAKGGADRVSFGAFAKGAGFGNRFERNVVVCEHLLQRAPGQRVGISLGGGGTGKTYCRDARCVVEQDDGTVQSNLIMACSDEGIYLNRAATSQVRQNTLLDTGGISVRFVESSAEVQGNLVDGVIRGRDGGVLRGNDNLQTSMTRQYLGSHPVRGLYRNLADLDLAWSASAPRRSQSEPAAPDLCGSTRPTQAAYGAFEDFSACVRPGQATPPSESPPHQR
jgi:nitrous oxidase accessory protein NosD